MDAVVKLSPVERSLADQFAGAASLLPGNAVAAAARAHAWEKFEREGLPHRRIEQWKYTDLRSLMREALPLAPAPDRERLDLAAKAIKAHAIRGLRRLVLVDGSFIPELSDLAALEGGLAIHSLADMLANGSGSDAAVWLSKIGPMGALNTALMTGGLVIDLAAGASTARPLEIVHVVASSEPSAAYTRSAVRLGAGANLTLVESFIGAGTGRYQVNDAVFVSVGDGARLDHVRLMEDRPEALNLSAFDVVLGKDAQLATFNLTSGAAASRYDLALRFDGEGSRAATAGVNLLRDAQHGDTTLFVDHAVPRCQSRESFRSVLDGHARTVFQGKIIVRPGAQKTDGKMMTRALLLSEDAEADHKPELEIFADDVACGHGATSGALDEDLLFYLRARGLPEAEAQALLIKAFIGDAIEPIADERLREAVLDAADRWLEERK